MSSEIKNLLIQNLGPYIKLLREDVNSYLKSNNFPYSLSGLSDFKLLLNPVGENTEELQNQIAKLVSTYIKDRLNRKIQEFGALTRLELGPFTQTKSRKSGKITYKIQYRTDTGPETLITISYNTKAYSQIYNVVNSVNSLTLDLEDFNNVDTFTTNIYNQMTPENLIGAGGVGKVYLVDSGKYIIKQVTPCINPGTRLYGYCSDILDLMGEKSMILIPYGEKVRYSIPNLLSEITIGMFFSLMIRDLETVNFTRTLTSFIVKTSDTTFELYIIMDAHKPILKSGDLNPEMKLTKPMDYMYLMFQTAHGLLQAQQKFKFTHYDLHIDNMLWDKFPQDKSYINYPIPNRSDRLRDIMIPKEKCNFIVKITDYGLSRIETPKTLVTPKIDTFPDATFGEFNASYDFISFIGTTLIDFRYRNPFNFLYETPEIYKDLLELVLWIFRDTEIRIPESPTIDQLQDLRMELGKEILEKSQK